MTKQWDEAMGEISGFGGGYEAVCRAMVLAGIEWIDKNPHAPLHYKGFKDVYGIVIGEDSPHIAHFEDAMMSAPVIFDGKVIQKQVRDDCTGAMHHAAVSHCLAYKRLGWDEYKKQLIEREQS